MFRKLSTYVLFLLLGTPLAVMAQGTGTLAGRVTDTADGQGLPGANVVIDGTSLGAATDLDGNYRIIGVPVGQYDITARFIGYEETTELGVEINSGYTREINFELRDDTAALDEIFVDYEAPLIQRDAIGAPRVISGEDIQNLPVRGVANVAALQGGVVSDDNSSALFIRGGRNEEVSYYVDGVKVVGAAPVAVNQAAIQEQEMLIGTIPARYGDVQSGVISITTRTGRDRFFGSAELITSEGLDAYGYNLAALSLGGPIVPGTVSFFISGQGNFADDNNPYGVETFRLTDDAQNNLLSNPQVLRFENEAGDIQYVEFPWDQIQEGFDSDDVLALIDVPEGFTLSSSNLINAPETFTELTPGLELAQGKNDPLRNITVNGNLNFTLSSSLSLRLGGAYDTNDREIYSFNRSLYNPGVFNNTNSDSYRVYGVFRQRISDQAFYQIQGEFQDYRFNLYPEGFSENIEDVLFYGDIDHPSNAIASRYFVFRDGQYDRLYDEDGTSRPGGVSSTFGLPGGILSRYQQQHDQQFRVSGSATAQYGVHQLEFGGEYEQETRRFFDVAAAPLSRYFADGNPELAVDGLPDGVTRYDQLPYSALRDRIVTRYGYNYLGTEEVNDQDIEAFLLNESNTNVAPYEPLYYAGYIQDKIEFRDLVINLGLRVDVFDNNTTVLRDIYTPFPIIRANSDLLMNDFGGLNPFAQSAGFDVPSGVEDDWAVYFNDGGTVVGYRDFAGNFYDTQGARVLESDITSGASGQVERTDVQLFDGFTPESRANAFGDYDPQVTVMPRVGVSFPVTDRALFFASYNVISQRPTEQAFTPFITFAELESAQSSRTPNPSLEPEKTTQYELGFRQRLGERAALTLSGFYRTQENKISNRNLNGGFPVYGTYLNRDFTTNKGVEVGFDLRRINNLAVNANYTLSFAEGTGSDAGATANIVWRGNFFPDFISPADFDQRHTANVSVDYRFGSGEGPMVSGMHLLENFGVNILGVFASGQHFTALEGSDFSIFDTFTNNTSGSINSSTLPATTRIDLKVDRSFNLGFGDSRLKAYVWVQNLLDTQNTLAVYRGTGLPDEDGYLSTTGGQTFLNSAQDPAGRFFNYSTYTSGPVNVGGNQSSGGGSFYSLPRRIRLGLLLDF